MRLPSRHDFVHVWLPLGLSQVIGIGCGLGAVAWVTRLVPPTVMADYGLWLSFATLGAWVVHAGWQLDTTRFWARTPDRTAYRTIVARGIGRQLPLLALACLVAGGVLATTEGRGVFWWLVPGLFAANIGFTAFTWGLKALQADRQHGRQCVVNAVHSLGRSFLPLVGASLAGASALVLSSGYVVAVLIAGGAALLLLNWHSPDTADLPAGRPIDPRDLRPAAWSGALDWLLQVVNRWIAILILGELTGGFFVLATNLAMLAPNFAGGVVNAAYAPRIFAKQTTTTTLRVADESAVLVGVSATLAVLALHGLAPVLVGNLIGAPYESAISWIAPIGLFATGLVIGNQYQNLLQAHGLYAHAKRLRLGLTIVALLGGGITATVGETWFAGWLMAFPVASVIAERQWARQWARQAPREATAAGTEATP